MNILFIGDIVGNPGRKAVQNILPKLRKELELDLVIANADNLSSRGRGASVHGVELMIQAGVDFFTNGDHTWKDREFVEKLDDKNFPCIRPGNYPPGNAGRGWDIIDLGAKGRVLIINVQGRVFMRDLTDDPLRYVEAILDQHSQDFFNAILIDNHAEATSEKWALGWYVDGRATAVVGTHTHVPTCDQCLLDEGTAYVSDLGMTGPWRSVLGVQKDTILRTQQLQTPQKFETEEEGPVDFRSCLIKTDQNGKALSIERVDRRVEPDSKTNKIL
jgi:metallophosphoesterase (TIGR00282 family)